MKRFAAHYLFVPGSGFLKQYAIEIEGGYICHIFPFSEEIESVEWFPGVILLTPQEESDINTLFNFTNIEKQKYLYSESYHRYEMAGLFIISFQFCYNAACRRNSAQTIAVAIATFSDSEVSRSAG